MFRPLRMACAFVLGLMFAPLSMAATTFVTMGSGATSGLYYVTAVGMAKIVNDAAIGMRIGARSTGGGVFNVEAIQDGALQLAITQNNVAYFAYRGTGIQAFEGKPTRNVRGLATLYPEVLHILARRSTGIHSLADLKGRTVYVGDIGSGAEQDAIAVLGIAGLQVSDLKTAVRGSVGNAVNMLRDGKIDAMLFTVGIGSGAIVEAAQTVPIELVPIDAPTIARLVERYPYYSGTVIPAGAYPHVETDTPAIAVKAMLVASNTLTAAEVQRLMTTLFSTHLGSLYTDIQNPNLKQYFKVNRALEGMSIPLHAGAVAFYKSAGVDVPASLIAP